MHNTVLISIFLSHLLFTAARPQWPCVFFGWRPCIVDKKKQNQVRWIRIITPAQSLFTLRDTAALEGCSKTIIFSIATLTLKSRIKISEIYVCLILMQLNLYKKSKTVGDIVRWELNSDQLRKKFHFNLLHSPTLKI